MNVELKYNIEKRLSNLLEYLIILLMLVIPFSRSIMNLLCLLIFLVWIVKYFICSKDETEYKNIRRWLLILSVIILLTFINSIDLKLSLQKYIGEFLKYLIIFLVTLEVFKQKKQQEKLFISFLISSTIFIIYGLYQFLILENGSRLHSTLNNPNPAGTYLMICSILGISLLLINKSKFGNLFGFFYSIFSLIALVYTYSRGAWLGFLSSSLILIYYAYKKKFNYNLVVIITLLIIISIILFLPGKVIDRFESIIDFESSSIQQRFLQYSTGLKIFMDNPILGVGPGQFPLVYIKYKTPNAREFEHIHNLYLHLLVELGLSGFISLMIFSKIYFECIKKRIGNSSWYDFFMIGIFIGIGIHNMFDVTFLYSQIGLLFIILSALWLNKKDNWSFLH